MQLFFLSLALIVSLILIVLGLPGLWIMVASAVTYNLIVPGDPIGWVTLVIVGILALVAELLDISLTGRYARKYGGSRRAGGGALIGRIGGGMGGFSGTIVGPRICASFGPFLGA